MKKTFKKSRNKKMLKTQKRNKSCKQNTANLVKSHSDAPSIEI